MDFFEKTPFPKDPFFQTRVSLFLPVSKNVVLVSGKVVFIIGFNFFLRGRGIFASSEFLPLAAQCEIPPTSRNTHFAQHPFEIVSQRGVSHAFCLVFTGYRASIAEIPLLRGGGHRTSASHALQGEMLRKRGRGYRTPLAMLRRQKKTIARNRGVSQQVLNPTPLNPTPATCHKRKRKLRCNFWNAALQKLHCNNGFSAVRMLFRPKSCAAASKKLQCNIEKAALQESGAFLPLSCGFQAPTFRHPRLGPAENR